MVAAGTPSSPAQIKLAGLWLHGAACTGPDGNLAEPARVQHAASPVELLVQPTAKRQQSQSQDYSPALSRTKSAVQAAEYLCPVYCPSRAGAPQAGREVLLEVALHLPADCQPDTLRLHGVCLSCSPSV